MKLRATLLFAAALTGVAAVVAPAGIATAEPNSQITVLYDAFGTDAAMKKDWGYSALVEISGEQILFDTGNDPGIFAANVKAKGVDLTKLDFLVLSHRHADHMAGLNHVSERQSGGEDLRTKGRIRHLRLVAAIELLPEGQILAAGDALLRRQAAGSHEIRHRLAGSQRRAYRQDDGNSPRHYVDRAGVGRPRNQRAQGMSLAVNTPEGIVLVVGCSHPGIEKIVEAAAAINPKIHLLAGGFHLVVAPDDVIARAVNSLKDKFEIENIAPGHCTGEPTFAALNLAYGDRYLYAGVGTSLPLGPGVGSGGRRGEGPALQEDNLATYRKLARREDPSAF